MRYSRGFLANSALYTYECIFELAAVSVTGVVPRVIEISMPGTIPGYSYVTRTTAASVDPVREYLLSEDQDGSYSRCWVATRWGKPPTRNTSNDLFPMSAYSTAVGARAVFPSGLVIATSTSTGIAMYSWSATTIASAINIVVEE